MVLRNSKDAYGAGAKILHWLSAPVVPGLLALGFFMVSLEFGPFKLSLYWWHKSFGTLLFFLVLVRVCWRFVNPRPAHEAGHAAWERTLAGIVHVLLYAGMIAMPVSGLVMSAAADFPRPFFGLFSIPDFVPGKNMALFDAMRTVHEAGAWALLIAVALHGAGAFKHHLIDRDDTLRRMLPGAAPRAGAVVAGVLFVVLIGAAAFFAVAGDDEGEEGKGAAPPPVAAVSAPVSVPVAAADAAIAPHWLLVPGRSRIGFRAQVQGQDFEGQFTDIAAAIFFDPADPGRSSVDVSVGIAGVRSGSPERDGYMVMPAWLDAESFPESRFVANNFEKTGVNQYIAHGSLTLRGMAQPVDVPFTLQTGSENGETVATLDGAFTIDRLSYGIGTGEWSDPQTVANAVTISVLLVARRDSPP